MGSHLLNMFKLGVIFVLLLIGVSSAPEGLSTKDSATNGIIMFYEGNNGSQNQVCTISWTGDASWNFQHFDDCENDEARTAKILLAHSGTTISLYDSPSGSKDDDYTVIKIRGEVTSPVELGTFERSQTIDLPGGGTVEVAFHKDNGLDGKVSRMEVVIFKENDEMD